MRTPLASRSAFFWKGSRESDWGSISAGSLAGADGVWPDRAAAEHMSKEASKTRGESEERIAREYSKAPQTRQRLRHGGGRILWGAHSCYAKRFVMSRGLLVPFYLSVVLVCAPVLFAQGNYEVQTYPSETQ